VVANMEKEGFFEGGYHGALSLLGNDSEKVLILDRLLGVRHHE